MFEQGLRLMSVLSDFHGGRMDTFSRRMFNQKAVFILSRIGINDLEYPFNWYVRGPYSPELTVDLYESQGILTMIEQNGLCKAVLDSDSPALDAFGRLLGELDKIDPEQDVALKLEMIASIIYLDEQIPDGSDKRSTIREALPRLKEHFKDWNLDRYLSITSRYYRL